MYGIFYWIICLLMFLYSGYLGFQPATRPYAGTGLLAFLAFILIGLKTFPFHG